MRVKIAGKLIEISKAYIKNKNDRKYLVMVGVNDYIEGLTLPMPEGRGFLLPAEVIG